MLDLLRSIVIAQKVIIEQVGLLFRNRLFLFRFCLTIVEVLVVLEEFFRVTVGMYVLVLQFLELVLDVPEAFDETFGLLVVDRGKGT